MVRVRPNDDRDLLRAARFDQEYIDHWTNLFDDEDKGLAPYFRRLMVKLWEYEKRNIVVHKTAACRLIPVQHSVSAKKYIDLANERGWITFIEDRGDKRKTVVRPSAKLLEMVERHLLAAHEKIESTAAEFEIPTTSKILSLEMLGSIAQELRTKGTRLVLCHGAFDLLHPGHLRHFQEARRHGDSLFVTLDTDRFVDKAGGPHFRMDMRAEMVAGIALVDYVGIVDAPDALPAISAIRPHLYVKGAEYKGQERDPKTKLYAECKAIEAIGGQVLFTETCATPESGAHPQNIARELQRTALEETS